MNRFLFTLCQTAMRILSLSILAAVLMPFSGHAQTPGVDLKRVPPSNIIDRSLLAPFLNRQDITQEQIKALIAGVPAEQKRAHALGAFAELWVMVKDPASEYFAVVVGDFAVATPPPLTAGIYRAKGAGCPERVWAGDYKPEWSGGFRRVESSPSTESLLRGCKMNAVPPRTAAVPPRTAVSVGHPCGDPDLPNGYDEKDARYHFYASEPTIVCKASAACTPELVFETMLRTPAAAAPVRDGIPQHVEHCSELLLKNFGLGFVFDNVVKSAIDRKTLSITHYTTKDHIFYPGEIRRQILQVKGNVVVATFGRGVGKRADENIIGGRNMIWPDADEALKGAVEAQLAEKAKP